MCRRYDLTDILREVTSWSQVQGSVPNFGPRYNIAPS